MSQERRAAPRARLPGSFVHCEGAAGEHIQADVVNISTGGLFIRTAKPLAVGKRVSLKIQVGGATAPWWFAFARVIWVRASGTGDTPAGMGVRLLDVEDDAATETIARLVEERLKSHPSAMAPARERTVLGVGAQAAPAPPVPDGAPAGAALDADSEKPTVAGAIAAAPGRERTVLGVGEPTAAARAHVPRPTTREPSSVEPDPEGWDVAPVNAAPPAVVAPRVVVVVAPPAEVPAPPPSAASPRSEPPDSDSSLVAAGVPRRGGLGWFVLVLIVAIAGVGYVLRDRWLPRARALLTELTGPAAPTAPPSPSVAPPAASATTTASITPTVSAAAPSASVPKAPSAVPRASTPPLRPAVPPPPPPPPPAKPRPSEDNPY